jgi:hypothetical protein
LKITKPKVIFINHFSKSGATLLYSLFDNHPDVILIPAFLDFPRFWKENNFTKNEKFTTVLNALYKWNHLFEKKERSKIQNVGKKYESVIIKDKKRFIELTKLNWKSHKITWTELFYLVHHTYCLLRGINFKNIKFIICHPHGFDNIDKMSNDIFDSKVIHILRDPRAANYSYKITHRQIRLKLKKSFQLEPHKPDIYFPYLSMRLFALADIKNFFKDKKKHKIIRFEDLHLDPKKVMQNICRWIGLEWKNSLLTSSFMGKTWGGNSVSGKLIFSFSKSKAKDKKWLYNLSRDEVILYEALCAKYLKKFKYKFAFKQSKIKAFIVFFKLYFLSVKETSCIIKKYFLLSTDKDKIKNLFLFSLKQLRFIIAFLFFFIISR